ncbi:hypothetical protein MP228_000906 [Amoeboaphelidium protococcarum]|nr:hypothetical protein MP228_000906 [Amoeboaphelidium protococcarum]
MNLVIYYALMMIPITWSMVKVQSAATEQSTTPMVCDIHDDPQCAASNTFDKFPEFSELIQMQILEQSGNHQAFAVSHSAWNHLRAKSDQDLMVKAREADRLHLLMKQWLLQGKDNLVQQLQSKYNKEQSDPRFAEIVCGYADKEQYIVTWANAVKIQDYNQQQIIRDTGDLLQSCIKSAFLQQNQLTIYWTLSMQPLPFIQASAIADALHEGGLSAFAYIVGVENGSEVENDWQSVWESVPWRLCELGDIAALQMVLDYENFPRVDGQLSSEVVSSIWEQSFSRFDPKLWRYVMSRRDLLMLHLAFLSIKEIMLLSTKNLIERGQNNGYLPAAFRQRMIKMAIKNQNPESIAYLANCPIQYYDELMALLQPEGKFQRQFRIKEWVERYRVAVLIKVEPVQSEWEKFCQDYKRLVDDSRNYLIGFQRQIVILFHTYLEIDNQ